MKQNILPILLLVTVFVFTSCRENEVDLDPAEAILGKWEKIEIGNWPDMDHISEPSGYREYLPDSIMVEYNYESGDSFYTKYSIDTLLYEYVSIPNGSPLILKYKYQFLDNNNKLRTDVFEDPSMFSTLIFKRIN